MSLKGATEADAYVNASRDLLNQGDAVGAERVLSPVLGQFRSDPPVLHLMGQIKRAQNELAEAERHFRAAIASGGLSEGHYYNDLGMVLQARGVHGESIRVFRAALALMPQLLMIHVSIVRGLMALGEMGEAEREAHAYVAAHPGPESWTLLGTVQRAQERYQDALVSAEAALKYGRNLRGLRYNYAVALDKVGRGGEALAIYEQLAAKEIDTPDLALNYARALYAQGKKKEAEAIVEQGVEQWPGVPQIHSALARMRWLRGEGEKCAAVTEGIVQFQRPTDMALRLASADALHRGGHRQKALAVLDQAVRLAPDAPPLLTAMAVVLDELERPLDALKMLRRVAEIAPSRSSQRNLLSTLLRAGQAGEALSIARDLRKDEPEEQYLLACEATALRMLEDPAYATLYDYDRFVRSYEVQAPRGFFTMQNFNASLADALRLQHRTNAHPLDQHIPNGSQTGRSLLSVEEPNLKHFLTAIDGSVRDYINRLAPSDPVGRRRSKHYRYSNLWSVRLTDNGYEPNHVHDRGWISGLYWVASMPAERPSDPRAGWLTLGEPNRPPKGCGAERWFEPVPGTLMLFPSYMWSGTLPFEGAEALNLGFTVLPG